MIIHFGCLLYSPCPTARSCGSCVEQLVCLLACIISLMLSSNCHEQISGAKRGTFAYFFLSVSVYDKQCIYLKQCTSLLSAAGAS